MKKLIAILICLSIILTFASCKNKKADTLENEEVIFDINDLSSQISSDTTDETSSEADNNYSGETSSSETSLSSSDESTSISSDTSSNSQFSDVTSSEKQEETSSEDKKPVQNGVAEDTFDMGIKLFECDGIYFPDINETYKYAAEIYADLINFTFDYDEQLGSYEIKIDNSVGYYWRVNDTRFNSVARLENYLDAYFTKDCQKTFYNAKRFVDHEGKLYASIGGVAGSETYAGCSFKLTKQTTRRICFTGTAYYYKSADEIEPETPYFTLAPKDPSKYDTKTVEFELQSSEDGMTWLFTKFGYIG